MVVVVSSWVVVAVAWPLGVAWIVAVAVAVSWSFVICKHAGAREAHAGCRFWDSVVARGVVM